MARKTKSGRRSSRAKKHWVIGDATACGISETDLKRRATTIADITCQECLHKLEALRKATGEA